ncbi:hypothetical protein [Parasedimentitalea huanghaiensis]|uniref:Uncharacterized protein n=1 Tax=Parasedimentitalea huanghaiensis TaxID=2682100 RepID=A0A6L6WC02_9RHOB|nr:hypothetical protein [Zongyanglinia huanghaiensis]MVO15224.1 hypothetical protein [Zongyanglinia huanghaiensis]
MHKWVLSGIGVIYALNALVMWFLPEWWYVTVPGITMMGPFNLHFVRDIGLVYLVSGLGLIYGIRAPQVAVFGCLWPALHALFHAWIFFQRGMPVDFVAATNLVLIQLPAWLSLWSAWSLLAVLKNRPHKS